MNISNYTKLTALSLGLIISMTRTGSAGATVVNLDGILNAGLDGSDAVYVTLAPGTYTIDPIQGTYTAFNRFGYTAGCDGSGGNCTEGWEFSYSAITPTGTVSVGSGGGIGPISGGGYYSTATEALTYAESHYAVGPFTLTSPTNVGFYINDDILSDNIGGISLDITSVPEPATWAMILVGLGGLGVAMRSRRTLATKTA